MPKGVVTHRFKAKELVFKEDQQYYAKIEKCFGGPMFLATVHDYPTSGQTREVQSVLRGALRRKTVIRPGTWVLVSERDFSSERMDIIGVYTDQEYKRLVQLGEIVVASSGGIETDETEVAFDDI